VESEFSLLTDGSRVVGTERRENDGGGIRIRSISSGVVGTCVCCAPFVAEEVAKHEASLTPSTNLYN
jgi:hypothetical protein